MGKTIALWDPAKHAFYEYNSCPYEPGPSPSDPLLLHRCRLGPQCLLSRYYVTEYNLVIMASEVGDFGCRPRNVSLRKWSRLQRGRMFLVDFEEGRIVEDLEIEEWMARSRPYRGVAEGAEDRVLLAS